MVRILATFAALFSVQAFACPNLTGTYTCNYGNGQSEQISVSQRVDNGVTYYKYNNDEFAADGSVVPLQDGDDLKEATFKAWCEANTLKNQIQGKYYNNGTYFGDLDMVIDITNANGNLQQKASGSLKGSQGNYPINNDITCTKN